MDSFRAFRIVNEDGKIHGSLVNATRAELSNGDVLIKASYSSVNYKDALAATGTGKILRRFPLIGGIDVAGVVASSTDTRFREGDEVLVTSAAGATPSTGPVIDGGASGSSSSASVTWPNRAPLLRR